MQCLTNKLNVLEFLLNEMKPLCFCISEHWILDPCDINLINLTGYCCIANYCRQTRIHGGTAIFVNKDVSNVKCIPLLTLNDLSVEMSFECSAVSFNGNTCIVVLYRSPSMFFAPVTTGEIKCIIRGLASK